MFGAKKLGGRTVFRLAPWLCAAGGVMSGVALPARADHRCGPQCRPVWVPPVYEKCSRVVVTPARFEDVIRRVWRDPVYEERRVLTKVPAEFRWVERPVYDSCGRWIGYERVEELVRPAYDRWEIHQVMICPGRWEEIRERVMVCPEKREVIWEDVLVREGYWKCVCGNRPIPLIDDLRNSTRPGVKPVMPISIRPIYAESDDRGFGGTRWGILDRRGSQAPFRGATDDRFGNRFDGGSDGRFADRADRGEALDGFGSHAGPMTRWNTAAKAPIHKRPMAVGR